MASIKISQLPNLPTMTGPALVPAVANGTTYSVTGSSFSTYVLTNLANTTISISTTGNITATRFSGDGGYLSNINGANITGNIAANINYALYSNVANVANSVAVANVTGIGNIATINLNGSSGQVLYGNGVWAAPSVSSYGDSNVVSLLGNFGSNNILTTGTITSGNIQVNSWITTPSSTDLVLQASTLKVRVYGNLDPYTGGMTLGGSSPWTGLNVSGNANVGNLSTSGIVTAGHLAGEGGNISNIQVGNVTGLGNVSLINKDGNASNVLYGNGVFAAKPSSTYGDSNVVTLLGNFGSNNIFVGNSNIYAGGNLQANALIIYGSNNTITTTNNGKIVMGPSRVDFSGNIVVTGNATIGAVKYANTDGTSGQVLTTYGNGVTYWSTVSGGNGSYSNSNVATFLASYGSNTITTTGNVSVGNIIGNGQALTGINGSNVTGQVSYAAVANSVALANVSGAGNIASINISGNASQILYGNGVFGATPSPSLPSVTFVSANGTVTKNTVQQITNSAPANIQLTLPAGSGLSTGDSVTFYPWDQAGGNFQIYTIKTTDGVQGLTAVGGTYYITGNIPVQLNWGGSYWYYSEVTTSGGGSSYSNSNATSLLASFGSNTITTTGNISVGNISATGDISASGNVIAAGGYIRTGAATAYIVNTTPTTVYFAGNSTATYIGNSSGTVTFPGNVSFNGGTVDSTASTVTLYNTPSTVSLANGASNGTLNLGSGPTGSGNTININFGTNGLSGSNTKIIVGSNVSGATSTITFNATLTNATSISTASSVGYLGIPQNSQNTDYTLTFADQGKHVYATATANIIIPSNANVAYPVGTTISLVTASSGCNVQIQNDTLIIAGNGTSGNRTLSSYGMATIMKVASTTWYISGAGVS